ncbi:diacylglycerol kinase [Methylophaga sp.]|uniref:diacylglycerol kinase n=1 Tax=Methylophaga sp. TaxID=2024840 RepID=UPI0027202581|nr:diacylglycerol kinase [Methylophaga sp.]MDO8827444.1 diacylglycerol kinase [Methylophaga sp.]
MQKHTGYKRLFYAFGFSFQGLVAALRIEIAFRQAFLVLIIASGFSFFLDVSAVERLALIVSLLLLVLVEALNSAIECVVDRISPEHHLLSGRAKDYGSLAVLIAIIIALATWLTILWPLI